MEKNNPLVMKTSVIDKKASTKARKAAEYPASLNNIPKQNNPHNDY